MGRLFAKGILDAGVWVLLTPLAFALRLESGWTSYVPEILMLMAVGLPLKAGVIWLLGWHRRSWRRVGVRDLFPLLVGVLFVTLVVSALGFFAPPTLQFPRSVPLIEAMLALLALGGMRLSFRVGSERSRARSTLSTAKSRRVLIAGAGEAGVMVAREMLRHPESGMVPLGFLDDDPSKHRERYVGLRVFGSVASLPEAADEYRASEVLIAMPAAGGAVVRRVVQLAREADIEHRIVPALHDLVSGSVDIAEIRNVDVEDLLRRDPVRLETDHIGEVLRDRTILVTGAGGSIGSELVRQIASFGPARLVLLGRGENSVFDIDRELSRTHPGIERIAVIADVRDAETVRCVFERYRPEVVFHAAAHKHVPLMEANPEQAVFNNVIGTRNLLGLAREFGVARFVNISTDKAVNPTSIMGASKRVAEMLVQRAAEGCGPECTYVSVRFGNVLGSRGSVIPYFRAQIERGGPVTVTHPAMQRYFMTIPEASQLVLQAASMGLNGAVCVLDMGEPVKIVDLARDLILLCGKEPDEDIEIEFTGMRPGEKLFEELLQAEEGTLPSAHEKIFVARAVNGVGDRLERQLEKLLDAAAGRDEEALRRALQSLVPTCQFDVDQETVAIPALQAREA